MSNDYFRFQQFTIRQESCAMKVGTDGVLLGAWAQGGKRILDIGTGTGLIALMMAQRFPDAEITGIDIDENACRQAEQNVAASPFSQRVSIQQASAVDFRLSDKNDTLATQTVSPFDAIVSNPPYFNHALKNPDEARKIARHTDTLNYSQLFECVSRLLADNGVFSAVIPFDCLSDFQNEAKIAGLFTQRICAVRTIPTRQPRRFLLAFGKHPVPETEITEETLETHTHERSEWYEHLTSTFYLKKTDIETTIKQDSK